jgi:hypothetical protein
MEWIKPSKKLPEINCPVLCYDTQRIYIAYRREEEEYNEHWTICEENCSCYGCTGAITHWMPLPIEPN